MAQIIRYDTLPHGSYGVLTETTGDVLHFNVLGQSIILLNSEKAALDLLDNRAKIYSDRPHVPFVSL